MSSRFLQWRRSLGVLVLASWLKSLVDAQGYDNECYYARGRPAGSAFLPCKDPERFGTSHCCQNGDICLSDNACWNPPHNVTYQFGCTDPDYEGLECPEKCGLDVEKSHWVALIYCVDAENVWACHHPDTCSNCPDMSTWLPAIMSLPEEKSGCSNLKTASPAFAGPTSLRPSVWLPSAGEGTPTYFSPQSGTFTPVAGYTPPWYTTERIASTTTSSSSSSASTSSSPIGPTETEISNTVTEDENDGGSGLSMGAKAGIGVGAGVAALAIIALAALALRSKRKDRIDGEKPADAGASQPMTGEWWGGGYGPESTDSSRLHRMSELPSEVPSQMLSPSLKVAAAPSPAAGQFGYPGDVNAPYSPHSAYTQTPHTAHVPEGRYVAQDPNKRVSELPATRQHEIHEMQ